jgi:DNA-binding NarL/FixJ family response regulator
LAFSDELMRQRIRDSLSSDAITVFAEAPDVAGLSDRAAGAGVIVLGVDVAAIGRREAIRAANLRFERAGIVVVTPRGSNGVHKALEAGARGLVWDSDIECALAPAIRAVCNGLVVVPRQLRRQVVRPALSHREKETLALATAGLSNRQIADRLYLAESTVKSHLSSVFAKLGVDSRSEAARLALDPDEKLGISVLGGAGGGSAIASRGGG